MCPIHAGAAARLVYRRGRSPFKVPGESRPDSVIVSLLVRPFYLRRSLIVSFVSCCMSVKVIRAVSIYGGRDERKTHRG
jgi:hypothetical protein